jgi:hypothetical protein
MEQARFAGNDPGRPSYQEAKRYPTPKTNGFCSGSGAAGMVNDLAEAGQIDEETRRSMRAGNGGQLNPDWVELLMGVPMGFTSLEHINMTEFGKWEVGFAHKMESGTEAMRILRENDEQESTSERETGRQKAIRAAEILQSFVRQQQKRCHEVGVALAGQEVSEDELRSMWNQHKASSSPHRWELHKPKPGEPTNAMCLVSQIYPSYGSSAWMDGTWESTVGRTTKRIDNRVDRLKTIGNGQVPQTVALAWEILYGRIEEWR